MVTRVQIGEDRSKNREGLAWKFQLYHQSHLPARLLTLSPDILLSPTQVGNQRASSLGLCVTVAKREGD